MKKTKTPPDPQKHSRDCGICAHRDRDEIEREFVEWRPIAAIAKARKIPRASLYRHVHATGLFEKRGRNVKAALAKIIERCDRVHVTSAAVISAIAAYAKINSETGEWIDKIEDVNARGNMEKFDKMTQGEMLKYAQTGELPEWWNSSPLSGTR
jgi:hypothetical protein